MYKAVAIATIILASVALAACATPQPTAAPTEVPTIEPTAVPAEVVTPTGATAVITSPIGAWTLATLNGQPPAQGTTVTLELTTDGTAAGSDGCNRYSTTYTMTESALAFAAPMAGTKMACPEPVMTQATAYTKALTETKTYAIADGVLTLSGADGAALATFGVQKQDLAGTGWTAIEANNGKEAVVSIAAGITITATFGTDGNLTGFGGCNIYNGPYTTDGNKITIGPLISTQKACEQAVMDQETAYLTAIQSAATYKIEADTLQLRTAADAIAATFKQATATQ
jgi:heat shock protein HslJ